MAPTGPSGAAERQEPPRIGCGLLPGGRREIGLQGKRGLQGPGNGGGRIVLTGTPRWGASCSKITLAGAAGTPGITAGGGECLQGDDISKLMGLS